MIGRRSIVCRFARSSGVSISSVKRMAESPWAVIASKRVFPVDLAIVALATVPSGRRWSTKTAISPVGCEVSVPARTPGKFDLSDVAGDAQEASKNARAINSRATSFTSGGGSLMV